jgi:hypothetical protein
LDLPLPCPETPRPLSLYTSHYVIGDPGLATRQTTEVPSQERDAPTSLISARVAQEM